MKILGMGIPELAIILIVVVIVAAVIFAIRGSSKSKHQSGGGSTHVHQAEQANASISDLRGYKDLLDMGAITQEEYDEKKKDLLGL